MSQIIYADHDQDAEHKLIFRYDNAAHRQALPQQAHRHTRSGIEASPVPTLVEGMAVKMGRARPTLMTRHTNQPGQGP
jgi:hypothetical protein